MLLISFVTANVWAIPAGIEDPAKPRFVETNPTDGQSATKLISSSYGDVINSLAKTESERQRLTIRLALAYRLFNRGLSQIGGTSTGAEGNKFYAPSPETLLRVEGMLPTVPASERSDVPAEYVKQLEPRLQSLGPTAYKELMGYVAKETTANENAFDDETVTKAKSINTEDGNSGVMARVVSNELDVPDGPATGIDSDGYTAPGQFVNSLPNSTPSALDESTIAGMSERQLKDMIKAIESTYSPQAQENLSKLQTALARLQQKKALEGGDNDEGTNVVTTTGDNGTTTPITVAANNGDPQEDVSLADIRARDIDQNMGSRSRVPAWFDATLRNLTDFFHTGKEEEDGEEGADEHAVYDPLTGDAVEKDELSFEDELSQYDSNEGLSQRGVDDR